MGKNGSGKTVRDADTPHRRDARGHPSAPAPRAPHLLAFFLTPQTIIECLKMATTGDLPPGCRGGQAFVNDPNALGTAEARCFANLSWLPWPPGQY